MTRADGRRAIGPAVAGSLAAALLAAGCAAGPAIDGVEPAALSARGGALLTIAGAGFADGAEVWLGDTPAAASWLDEGTLEVVAPPLIAGPRAVTVRNPDGGQATLDGALEVWALALAFVEAPPDYLPALAGVSAVDAAVADLDGDGAPDVVVAAPDGRSTALHNLGLGAFVDASVVEPYGDSSPWPRGLAGAVRAVVVGDLDGDAWPDVFACVGDGQLDRLLHNVNGHHLADLGRWLAPDADDCAAATLADLDGDGATDLVVAGAAGGDAVRVLRRGERDGEPAFAPLAALELAGAVEGDPAGAAWVGDEALEGSFTLTADDAAGGGWAAALDYDFAAHPGEHRYRLPLPAIDDSPGELALALDGDGAGVGLSLRVLDADGEAFRFDWGAVDWSGWAEVTAGPVAAWPAEDGEAAMDLPLQAVEIALADWSGDAGRGVLRIDELRLSGETGAGWLVDDFERSSPGLRFDAQVVAVEAADLDGDGAIDLAIGLAGAPDGGAARVLLNRLAAFADDEDATPAQRFPEAGTGAVPDVGAGLAALRALDADGDGDLDLLAVVAGDQDRLLLNDGSAHFFDGTLAALPVDWSDGAAAEAVDMDRDGRPDLLIANRGAVDRLYVNGGDGRFDDRTPALPLYVAATARLLALDADGDGDRDVIAIHADGSPPRLFVSVPGEDELD